MMRIRIPATIKAATTAIRGKRSSRKRFIFFFRFEISDLKSQICGLWSLVFGVWSVATYTTQSFQRQKQRPKTEGPRPKSDLVAARHQQSNLLNRPNFRINFPNDSTVVNYQQTIRQRRHFFQLG